MAALKIVYKDPGQLKPRAKNPRTHTRRQIRQIAASHHRIRIYQSDTDRRRRWRNRRTRPVEAAKLLGMSDVTAYAGTLRNSTRLACRTERPHVRGYDDS